MKSLSRVLFVLFVCLFIVGCPNGSDRVFGVYGIYYSFDPAGYVWAEYRVPSSDKATVSPVHAFRLAAGELLKVVRHEAPLLNSRPADMKSARFVAIAGSYSEFDYKSQIRTDEKFGAIIFSVDDLERVAHLGPTTSEFVSEKMNPNERIFEYAQRWISATSTH